jgi:hypothetical protein
LGDSCYIGSDSGDLVAKYECESGLKYAEQILTFLLIGNVVQRQTMLFVVSKCVSSEVFPMLFVAGVVENILIFMRSSVLSIDDSNDIPVHSPDFDGYENYYDTHLLHNEGSDYWDTHSDRSSVSSQYHHWLHAFGVSDPRMVFNYVSRAACTYIDSGASVCGTPSVSNLLPGTVKQGPQFVVHGSIGATTAMPDAQGLYGSLGLDILVMKELNSTLLSVSAICDGGKDKKEHVCLFDKFGAHVYVASEICDQVSSISYAAVPVMSFVRENNLYALQKKVPSHVSMFLFSIKPRSLYTELHRVTGHGGVENQKWHRKNSVNAQYTIKDAAESSQRICEACVRGGMQHVATDHRKEHQLETIRPGQKFTIDCYTHKHVSRAGNKYADVIVDLASRRVHVLVA